MILSLAFVIFLQEPQIECKKIQDPTIPTIINSMVGSDATYSYIYKELPKKESLNNIFLVKLDNLTNPKLTKPSADKWPKIILKNISPTWKHFKTLENNVPKNFDK